MILRFGSLYEYGEYYKDQFVGEITECLDKLAGLDEDSNTDNKHYIEYSTDITLNFSSVEYLIKIHNIQIGTIDVCKGKIIGININIAHKIIKYNGNMSIIDNFIGEDLECVHSSLNLIKKSYADDQYFCHLTQMLDKVSNLDKHPYRNRNYVHYLLIDKYVINNKELKIPIRVPGCTIGCVYLDDNYKIINISLRKDDKIISYPENVDDIMKNFIGVELNYENL